LGNDYVSLEEVESRDLSQWCPSYVEIGVGNKVSGTISEG